MLPNVTVKSMDLFRALLGNLSWDPRVDRWRRLLRSWSWKAMVLASCWAILYLRLKLVTVRWLYAWHWTWLFWARSIMKTMTKTPYSLSLYWQGKRLLLLTMVQLIGCLSEL